MSDDPLLDLMLLVDLERRIGRGRLADILRIQIDNNIELLKKLSALGPSPDPTLMFPIFHQMAGASGTLGMKRLSRYSLDLEMALSGGEAADGLGAKRDYLHALSEETIDTVRALYPELAPDKS